MASSEDLEQSDSGMASRDEHVQDDIVSLLTEEDDCNEIATGKRCETGSVREKVVDEHNDDYDHEEDESLAERLLGLTEMFPAEVRKCVWNIGNCLFMCTKGLYAFSRSATWLFFSSSAILFAPILFELERAQMEEAQRTQQKQVLLGPNTALSNVSTPGLPMAPPVQR